MDATQTAEVWKRLVTGGSLEGLSLPTNAGLTDLRGFVSPEPTVLRQHRTATAEVKELAGPIVIRGARWKGLDLSGARLASLRFFDSTIEDCLFERAECRDWRLWGTTVVNTSFRSADLRKAALGGLENDQRNSFLEVDFSRADLRHTAYVSCSMISCRFAETKLSKVDFQGTVFVDCTFEGNLEEVLFYPQALRGRMFPANEMRGVDLRRARLRHVEFRGLDMGEVQWPESAEHLVIDDYPAALDRALDALNGRADVASRKLSAVLAIKRKWAGPNQKRGVLSKSDLIEAGGPEAVAELLRVIGA